MYNYCSCVRVAVSACDVTYYARADSRSEEQTGPAASGEEAQTRK